MKTNSVVYRNGEKATLEMQVERRARIAVFNITADDKVVMLFPNEHEGDNTLAAGKTLSFPASGSPVGLVMQTLPDHKRDAEAFFVVAMDGGAARNFSALFRPGEPLSFSRFFAKYAELAEYCEDSIVTYEVVALDKTNEKGDLGVPFFVRSSKSCRYHISTNRDIFLNFW